MWKPTTEHPPIGVRIVALFNDGSGTHLFHVAGKDEYMDEEGELLELELADDYSHWALTPDGYTFWFERHHDEAEAETVDA